MSGFMSMNTVTLLYLVASVCFIQALKGLSHPTTSIRGNVFGMVGMAIAVLTTSALIVDKALPEDLKVQVRKRYSLAFGPGGRTLMAVQDLARVASQRKLGDHDTRLRIDVAGYRERRRGALEKFATDSNSEIRKSALDLLLEARAAQPQLVHLPAQLARLGRHPREGPGELPVASVHAGGLSHSFRRPAGPTALAARKVMTPTLAPTSTKWSPGRR